jgi:Replication-relaxation
VRDASAPGTATIRIGPSGRAALRLLACCPRLPTDVAAVLLGMRHTRSAAQLLLRLRTAGVADYKTVRPGPLVGSRVVRLWTLTPAGRTIVPANQPEPSAKAGSQLPYGQPARWRALARQRDVPLLVVAYRLLACVVRELDRPVRIAAWEHPWIRTISQTGTGRTRHVRLPAAATVTQDNSGGEQPRGLLLLPDLGTIPVASYRPVLRALNELTHISDANAKGEPLLVVGVAAAAAESSARVAAWQALLQQVARRSGEEPLRARVFAWPQGLADGRDRSQRLGTYVEQVFALVARHPLLTYPQLATLLDTSSGRIGQLVAQLTSRDWLRAIAPGDLLHDALVFSSHQRRHALVELSPAGRREAARRLLLPTTVAAKHHGLLGKATASRRFLRQFAHTLGANAVFVAFVLAARQVTQRGGNEALEEWRSAAACTRGRFRPDGYGCFRRAAARFGFFLEFDRGTERPVEHAAKLASYYRYRDSGAYTRDYASFPTLLVVTTTEVAEARFALQLHLAQQRYGGAPLPALLTTTDRIQNHPESVLGPIWRGPAPAQLARVYWLPGRPGRAASATAGGQPPSAQSPLSWSGRARTLERSRPG